MIENIIYLALPKSISERKLLLFTGLFCFILSSLADNITATLVSATLILSLDLELKKRIRFITLVLVIGSAAGIVAMSKIPGLTFANYLRYFVLLFIAYTVVMQVFSCLAR